MKLLFLLASILTLGRSVGYVPKANTTSLVKLDTLEDAPEFSEDTLETETFEKGSLPYKGAIIKINKSFDEKGNENGVKIWVNYKVLRDVIDDVATSSGMLTGKTRYETIGKENVFINPKYFLGAEMEVNLVDKKRKKSTSISAGKGNQILTESTPTLTLIPLPTVTKITMTFNPKWGSLIFGNKSKVKIDPVWGWIDYGDDDDSRLTLSKLFQEAQTDSKDSEKSVPLLLNFLANLKYELDEYHRPQSDDFEIVKANQGSEKKSLRRGYNINVTYDRSHEKPTFPINILLLPLILILGPFAYYLIRKIIRK